MCKIRKANHRIRVKVLVSSLALDSFAVILNDQLKHRAVLVTG